MRGSTAKRRPRVYNRPLPKYTMANGEKAVTEAEKEEHLMQYFERIEGGQRTKEADIAARQAEGRNKQIQKEALPNFDQRCVPTLVRWEKHRSDDADRSCELRRRSRDHPVKAIRWRGLSHTAMQLSSRLEKKAGVEVTVVVTRSVEPAEAPELLRPAFPWTFVLAVRRSCAWRWKG